MGEVFAGRYELVDPIGRGGVGAVWRAWDHRRRTVCGRQGPAAERRPHAAALRPRAGAADRPPARARPASWAADDDKVLFTMDLVGGGSLAHLIGDYGPLPPAFVCTLLDQLLSGLAAVHAEGVVHRDIKPANILLEATGTGRPHLRLSDFGISMRKGEPRLTETNYVVGTPGYFAPEQMLGAEPDFPADLFAVGLVALYLLAGRQARLQGARRALRRARHARAPRRAFPSRCGRSWPRCCSRTRRRGSAPPRGRARPSPRPAELLPDARPRRRAGRGLRPTRPAPDGVRPDRPPQTVPDVTTSGARTGAATGAGQRAEQPQAPDTDPGGMHRHGLPARDRPPIDPYREPTDGTPTDPATGGTHTGPGPRPDAGSVSWSDARSETGSRADPGKRFPTLRTRHGCPTLQAGRRPRAAQAQAPSNPAPPSAPPRRPGADSARAARAPDATSLRSTPGSPAQSPHPASPCGSTASRPRPATAAPPRPTHPPRSSAPASTMSDTGSFHLPPPQPTAPSTPPRHQPEHTSTPPTASRYQRRPVHVPSPRSPVLPHSRPSRCFPGSAAHAPSATQRRALPPLRPRLPRRTRRTHLPLLLRTPRRSPRFRSPHRQLRSTGPAPPASPRAAREGGDTGPAARPGLLRRRFLGPDPHLNYARVARRRATTVHTPSPSTSTLPAPIPLTATTLIVASPPPSPPLPRPAALPPLPYARPGGRLPSSSVTVE